MKTKSKYLGTIVVVIACMALLISTLTVFAAPTTSDIVGQWTDNRGHFITLNANGSGTLMDAKTSSQADVVISFTYQLNDIDEDSQKSIVFHNINITKAEGDVLVMQKALQKKSSRVIRDGAQLRIGGLAFNNKL